MSQLLEDCQSFIEANVDTTAYEWRYGRIWPEDSENDKAFIMIREMGEGASDIHQQQINLLMMVSHPQLVTAEATAISIARLFRVTASPSSFVRIDVMGGTNGPFLLENQKPFFEINLNAIVENR
mgnify:CR=1 FL=1